MSSVLRAVENKDSFTLVCGEAYVDGVMYGEAVRHRDPARDRDFILE